MGTTDYKQLIREHILKDEDFVKATFSGQHRDQTVAWIKVIVRPVLVQGKQHAQFSYFDVKKDITKNYQGDETSAMLEQLLALEFKNVHVQTAHNNVDITITNKGKALIHHSKPVHSVQETNLSHDRQKKVLLSADDDEAAPFLKAVGIMTEEGKISSGYAE